MSAPALFSKFSALVPSAPIPLFTVRTPLGSDTTISFSGSQPPFLLRPKNAFQAVGRQSARVPHPHASALQGQACTCSSTTAIVHDPAQGAHAEDLLPLEGMLCQVARGRGAAGHG
eukprot:scaffold130532_cov18-Tisochrysis_lutea.AAC.2